MKNSCHTLKWTRDEVLKLFESSYDSSFESVFETNMNRPTRSGTPSPIVFVGSSAREGQMISLNEEGILISWSLYRGDGIGASGQDFGVMNGGGELKLNKISTRSVADLRNSHNRR